MSKTAWGAGCLSNNYLGTFYPYLKPLDQLSCLGHVRSSDDTHRLGFVNFKDTTYDQFHQNHRGSSTKVSVKSPVGEAMAYKGISFLDYLTDESGASQHLLDACYQEIKMVN